MPPVRSPHSFSEYCPPEQSEKTFSESESIALPIAGEGDPSTPRRARREVASLFASNSVDGPFRSPQSSGETPSRPDYDPFEGAIMERISVGLVPVHIPRLTDPIAPCMGFAMQAEVVKGPNKFNAYRKAQRKAATERENRIEEPEGGLFFASRIRGRSPSVREACPFFLWASDNIASHGSRMPRGRRHGVSLTVRHHSNP
jgi:hypothetical protein